MAETTPPKPSFCHECGQPLRPGARFCPSCGTLIIPYDEDPAPAIAATPQDSTPPQPTEGENSLSEETNSEQITTLEDYTSTTVVESTEKPTEPEREMEIPPGCRLTLEAVPLQNRSRTLLALRQVLNLSAQDAAAYVAAAPVLLAVGLPTDTAQALLTALTNAGVLVTLFTPSVEERHIEPVEAVPEPHRRISHADETVQRIDLRAGLRTVTGLDLGKTNTYLAYTRADQSRLIASPEMIHLDAQSAIPTAIGSTEEGAPLQVGTQALDAWVSNPEAISLGLLDRIGEDDSILPILRSFFEILAHRVEQVLMPGALSISNGSTTTLGVPAGWDHGRIERLVEMAVQAGFPVSRTAPRPLAVLAYHKHQGTLKQETSQEKSLVIDWGGSSLALSFIEHGGDLPRPRVFEHQQLDLGGDWFDALLLQNLNFQLARDLNEMDQRAFLLFTRHFKEQLSKAFNEGKNSSSQYCVIPAHLPPVRIQMERGQFEKLVEDGLQLFRKALEESIQAVGLKPTHLNHVILSGGGARWYFAREILRETMGQAPLIGANPEEACARGLSVYRLDLPTI